MNERQKSLRNGLISLGVLWTIVIVLFVVFGNNSYVWATALALGVLSALSLNDDWKFYSRSDEKKKEKKRADKYWREREEQEGEYLAWCNPKTEEEKVLQKLLDGLLEIYDWDGMPRIKARLNPELETSNDRVAHYHSGFLDWRKPGHQAIEYKPSYYHRASIVDLKRTMKHELIHAWVEWLALDRDDLENQINKGHGSYFVWKSIEIGDEGEMANTLHHYPDMQIIYDRIRAGGNSTHDHIKREVEEAKRKRNA